jgi:hypothetical protein
MGAIRDIPVRALDVTTRLTDQVADRGVHKDGGALLETMLGRYVLDADGRELWQLIDGRRDVAEIVQEVATTRGLALDGVDAAVAAFCARLTELGLIDWRALAHSSDLSDERIPALSLRT